MRNLVQTSILLKYISTILKALLFLLQVNQTKIHYKRDLLPFGNNLTLDKVSLKDPSESSGFSVNTKDNLVVELWVVGVFDRVWPLLWRRVGGIRKLDPHVGVDVSRVRDVKVDPSDHGDLAIAVC